MGKAGDLLLDSTGDILIKSGDFVIGDADAHHMEALFVANQGAYLESPLTGMNMPSYINAPGTIQTKDAAKRHIKIQMELDGYSNVDVEVNDLLNINTNGERL